MVLWRALQLLIAFIVDREKKSMVQRDSSDLS